ncbi:MAG: ABC transporter permease [Planctomycetota bacterium]
MNRILTVAQRELMAMIGTKAFLVTLFMMPLLMGGGIVLMPLLSKMEGGKERSFAVYDGTGQLGPVLKAAAEQRKAMIEARAEDDTEDVERGSLDVYNIELISASDWSDEKQLELSEQVTAGDLYAFVEIPAALVGKTPESADDSDVETESEDDEGDDEAAASNPREIRFVSTSGALSEARGWFRQIIRTELRNRNLNAAGIDPAKVQAAEPGVSVVNKRPYKAGADGKPVVKDDGNEIASILAPFALMGLMFLVIFLAAQPMLESAMEEKTQKIAEVMLGNVSPREMLTGKLLGNVGGSLIVFILYAIGGVFALHRMDMLDMLPASMLFWFVIFQILGVLLFSSVFMVIGASVNQLKEAQSLLIPVWLVLMAPLMVWFNVLRDPNGMVATGFTFFPPSAPLMSILRLGTGAAIPSWQLPLAAVLLLITTVMILYLASRIYRASLLRSDGATTILQILKRAT